MSAKVEMRNLHFNLQVLVSIPNRDFDMHRRKHKNLRAYGLYLFQDQQ